MDAETERLVTFLAIFHISLDGLNDDAKNFITQDGV